MSRLTIDLDVARAAGTASKTRGKSARTLDTEKAILEIVEERAPITVRGVCYALFTRGLIDSMATKETARISRITTDMREAGELDWQQIVDGSRAVDRVSTWRDTSAIISAAVKGYRRNYWQDQPCVVEVWSEKSTVQGILAPVLDELGVTFRVMKGFGSFTAVKQAAMDSQRVGDGQHAVVLYIGDYDPSGLSMSEIDLPARLERYGSQWAFRRIAVTKADTANLPSFEAATKKADGRYKWFVENYGATCWELDAMDPNDLRVRVRDEIEWHMDMDAWEHAKEIEKAEVDSMHDFHTAWNQRMAAGSKS